MLCNSVIDFLNKRLMNKNYTFIPSQSSDGKEFVSRYNLGNKINDSVIIIKNNQTYDKSEAVFMIINDMPNFWKGMNIFKLLPLQLLNWIYDKVAKKRHLIFNKKKGLLCNHDF